VGHRAHASLPVVTLVVAASDPQAPHLDECLTSVREQTHDRLEVLVVGHGACEHALAVARAHATEDPRVTVLPGTHAGLGTARNAGALAATGRYLGFVGAADLLLPNTVRRLVTSLEQTGSALAVARTTSPQTGLLGEQHESRLTARPRTAVRVDQAPDAMGDLLAENKLFRRSFWRSERLSFPEAQGPGMTVPVVAAFVRARAFDVVPTAVYRWMRRGTGQSVGAQTNALEDLETWLTAQDSIATLLEDERLRPVREAWLFGVLDAALIPFLDDVERADDATWTRLQQLVHRLTGMAGADVMARIRVEPRLKLTLAAEGHRAALEELVLDRWLYAPHFETVAEGEHLFAALPGFREPTLGLADEVFELRAVDTPLVVSLRRVAWVGDVLELDLFAFVRRVPMDGRPEVRVHLVGDGTRREVPVVQREDPEVDRFADDRFVSYAPGALIARVDAAALAHVSDSERLLRVEVELVVRGVRRSGPVDHRDLTSSAAVPVHRNVGGVLVGPTVDDQGDLVLRTVRPTLVLAEGTTAGRSVHGAVTGPDAARVAEVVAVHPTADVKVRVDVRPVAGRASFSLDLPDVGFANREDEARHWRLRAVLDDGSRVTVGWPESSGERYLSTGPDRSLALRLSPRGNTEVVEVAGTCEVTDVTLGADEAVVTVSWLGRAPAGWSLSLRTPRLSIPGSVPDDAGDGTQRVTFPLTSDPWGLGKAPVPTGWYQVVLTATGFEEPLTGPLVGADLLATFPQQQRSDAFRMVLARSGPGRVMLRLGPPFADDEVDRLGQSRLRTSYSRREDPLDPTAVYLQSYTGHTCTDSVLAIHHELRRTRPDLTLYWGVATSSTSVPEGGVPVLIRSRAWYDVLTRATWLVSNVDFERWWHPREGQQVLQTFHGYPSKSMGIGLWSSKRFTPRRIAAELRRTSADWSLILTPTPEMDEHYRREYAYDGPILSHGYPRDDVLVSDQADAVRKRTRRLLGIAPHQKVVLYAPTWRDDAALNYASAQMVEHLDLEGAAQALGDDYVLLMRGHRFHRTTVRPAGSARVLDVTEYPEVNDLILAADAAVLDYSSMRFDFALTGRPMVFLVPDLDAYTGGTRGFLFPYEESAPGPLAATAEEAVELLRDLPGLSATYADDLAAFNARFNGLQDGQSARVVVERFFGQSTGLTATTT